MLDEEIEAPISTHTVFWPSSTDGEAKVKQEEIRRGMTSLDATKNIVG